MFKCFSLFFKVLFYQNVFLNLKKKLFTIASVSHLCQYQRIHTEELKGRPKITQQKVRRQLVK